MTTKQKKLIFIILGLGLLIFILIFGIDAYYQDYQQRQYDKNVNVIIESAQEASDLCLYGDLEKEYRVCCQIQSGVKYGLFYNCTSQEYFEAGQRIYTIINAAQFDAFYDPQLTHVYSELNYDYDRLVIDIYGTDVLSRQKEDLSMYDYSDPSEPAESLDEKYSMKITGTVPEEGESFILLKMSFYPNKDFDPADEEISLYREAQIINE